MKKIAAVLVILLFAFMAGCLGEKEAKKVSLEKRFIEPATQAKENELKIAVTGVISPKETFILYQELFTYMSKKLGIPVKLVQRETYKEINDMLREGRIDAALVCSGAYVEGSEFGMELLVAPTVNGAAVYYSYLIVPKDSDTTSFEQLRGKKFAFSDPLSNSGKLVPTYRLAKMNETPASFFSMYIFTYNHDKSIEAVAEKLVDGANVDSLIWDYLQETRPQLTAKTKIIEKSPPYGINPVVVSKNLNPALKEKLKQTFLQMHKDEEGRRTLEKLRIDRFVEIDDSYYSAIREMRRVVGKNVY